MQFGLENYYYTFGVLSLVPSLLRYYIEVNSLYEACESYALTTLKTEIEEGFIGYRRAKKLIRKYTILIWLLFFRNIPFATLNVMFLYHANTFTGNFIFILSLVVSLIMMGWDSHIFISLHYTYRVRRGLKLVHDHHREALLIGSKGALHQLKSFQTGVSQDSSDDGDSVSIEELKSYLPMNLLSYESPALEVVEEQAKPLVMEHCSHLELVVIQLLRENKAKDRVLDSVTLGGSAEMMAAALNSPSAGGWRERAVNGAGIRTSSRSSVVTPPGLSEEREEEEGVSSKPEALMVSVVGAASPLSSPTKRRVRRYI